MPKIRKSFSIEKDIADWLDHHARETDVPISRTVEKAVRGAYKTEIEKFSKEKGGESI